MMCRWLLAFGAPLSLLAAPASAFADEPPGCPPGEWFCDEPEAPAAAPEPPAAPDEGEMDGPSEQDDEFEPRAEPEESDEDLPPVGAAHGWSPAPASPWSLALRVQGVMLEDGGHDAGLGGVGASLRYALIPALTLDVGLDSILGTDYNGYDRSEASLSLSAILYLNPGKLLRTYLLAGINVSSARVDVGADEQSWNYFGGQTGLGLELSLDSHVALNIDVVAFMRGRTDSRAAEEPEFTDGSGRVSNTSGGGLLRGGLVLRF